MGGHRETVLGSQQGGYGGPVVPGLVVVLGGIQIGVVLIMICLVGYLPWWERTLIQPLCVPWREGLSPERGGGNRGGNTLEVALGISVQRSLLDKLCSCCREAKFQWSS